MTDYGTSFSDEVYDRLSPVTAEDAANHFALLTYIRAIGTMFQLVDWLSQDSTDGPGWSRLVNVNVSPAAALQWLGQFVGVDVPDGSSETTARALIQGVGGWQRGTPASIIAAAQQYLTGTKRVTFREREGGDAWMLGVTVKTSETPDSAKVLAAIQKQVPAGILLDFNVLTGQDYATVYNGGATTYATVFTTYANYQNLLDGVTGNVPVGGQYGTGTYGSGAYGG